jgi:hypothetical protein
MESVRDAYIFHRGDVFQQIFLPEPLQFWIRIMVVLIIMLFSLRTDSMLKKLKQSDKSIRISRVALIRDGFAFGVMYWIIEAIRDVFIFGKGTLISRIVTPEPMDIWIRLLAIFVLLLFSAHAQSIINTQSFIREQLLRQNQKLGLEFRLSQMLLDKERNQRIQAEGILNVALNEKMKKRAGREFTGHH